MHPAQQKMNNYFNRLPQMMQKHCQRTGQYMRMILMAMDMGNIEKKLIWEGLSPFDYHDIGVLLLPETLINQTEPYTKDQELQMMGHVDYGQQILEHILGDVPEAADFLNAAEDIILFHHECWDGSGYPDGREKEEIPFLGRVCAVANCYTAILEGRPSRQPGQISDALNQLKYGSGKWFDPEIVAAFTQYIIKGEAIMGRTLILDK